MATRSRRAGRSRRRRKSGWLTRVVGFALLALVAAAIWFVWRSRETASVEDRVMEMIRENPSAEVLAPGPSGAVSEDAPEVFRMDEPAPEKRKSKAPR